MTLQYDQLFDSIELQSDTIPMEVSPFEDTNADLVLRPGDRFQNYYLCEKELRPDSYLVKHIGLLQNFELQFCPPVDPQIFEHFKNGTSRAAMSADDRLGFVLEIGSDVEYGNFIVHEYVDGRRFGHFLDLDTPWSIEEALDFATAIGQALSTLHELGLAHGLTNSDAIRFHQESGWKLIPELPNTSGNWRPMAPEIAHPTDTTAASDQYVLAALLYRMLTGSFPEGRSPLQPSSLRVDLPNHFDRALMKALSPDPKNRWENLSEMLSTLRRGVRFWRQPSIVPFDAREASMLLKLHPDLESMAPALQKRPSSVLVRAPNIQTSADMNRQLHVTFDSMARLRREFRRNIVFGCLFVPMVDPPMPGTDVDVSVGLASHSGPDCVRLVGTITNVTEGDSVRPSGCGILLDETETARLHEWLETIEMFGGITPETVVEAGSIELGDANVSADGVFVASYIVGPTSVASLRASLMGLPIDVDSILKELIQAKVIQSTDTGGLAEMSQPAGSREAFAEATRRISALPFDETDRKILLERIREFDQNFNRLGAQLLTERALAIYPDDAGLIAQRAIQLARYELKWEEARDMMKRACELAPDDEDVQSANGFLKALSGEIQKLLNEKATEYSAEHSVAR